MRTEQLQTHSTEELAQACAQQASRDSQVSPEPDPCYELLCRAFADPPDDDAWQAILKQYQRLVRYWLGQHADEDTVQGVFIEILSNLVDRQAIGGSIQGMGMNYCSDIDWSCNISVLPFGNSTPALTKATR